MNKHFSRRAAISHGTVSCAAFVGSSVLYPQILLASGRRPKVPECVLDGAQFSQDPRIRALIEKGVDAALRQRAEYCDVRITHTKTRRMGIGSRPVLDEEEISVGVRCLVGGYWGFASSPVWTEGEMERLATIATKQAIANGKMLAGQVKLAKSETIRNANWTMPIAIDPFSVHPNQIVDQFVGLLEFGNRQPGCRGFTINTRFKCQDKAFGSSEGSYITQRSYLTDGQIKFVFNSTEGKQVASSVEGLSPAGVGLEMFNEDRIRSEIILAIDKARFISSLPSLPIDVGRYETVLSSSSTASLLSGTVGKATELDRILGFEANATGTSYLKDPQSMLNSEIIGSKDVTISADRSLAEGAATVGWDDEGVAPRKNNLITNGILTGFQTNRETAAWLNDSKSIDITSTGCAYADYGISTPNPFSGNLTMKSSESGENFQSMIESIKDGIALDGINVDLDFQQSSGLASGLTYKIKDGKIVSLLQGSGILFRASELWKSVKSVGGANSRKSIGFEYSKGEPSKTYAHTVVGVSLVTEPLTYIDITRKG